MFWENSKSKKGDKSDDVGCGGSDSEVVLRMLVWLWLLVLD